MQIPSIGRKDQARLGILAAGLLVVLYYSFSAGGFFLVRRSYGELLILFLLLLGLLLGVEVKGKLPLAGRLEMGLLGAFTLWILLSVLWSYIPARSFEEFTRALLYLAGFALFWLYLPRRHWLAWLGHLFVLIAAAVAIDSMLGKVMPDVISHPDLFESNRLNYPLTYWNAMALMMVMTFPVALRVAASRPAPLPVRCLYAAALFLFLSVLFFTFSRAGIVLLAVTLAVHLAGAVGSRLRLLLHAGLASLWTVVLVAVCYLSLPAMVESVPDPGARVSEGHQLGVVMVLLLLAAAGTQAAVWWLEGRVNISAVLGRRIGASLAVAGIIAVLAGGALAVARQGGPGSWLEAQAEVITGAERTEAVGRAEERLLSFQSERYREYAVSLGAFTERPLQGTGAGTWIVTWFRDRPYDVYVTDGHSLLFETMAELGLVGTIILLSFAGVFAIRSIRDLRFLKAGRERRVFAAFFASCAAFLMHAMIDWDWEMPAVALPFFMISGALLRYGAISRDRAGGEREEGEREGGESREAAEAAEATGIQRWMSWRLPVAVACIIAMLSVTFPLLSQLKIQEASQLARKGDAAGQERAARKAHSLFPLDAAPLKLEAAASSSRGRIKTAEALLQKALELEPYNDSIYRELAQLYIREGNLEMAREMVRKSLELNPLESRHTQILEGQLWERGGGQV